jgi:SOS-response transcriptional repressor LexA
MKNLTDRQQAIYDYILEYARENQSMPTHDDIGRKFSIKACGARQHVMVLAKKGYIELKAGVRRNITLTDKSFCPYCGHKHGKKK